MQSVLTQISVVVIGYAAFVALIALFAIARWRARPPWLVSLVWMLEFLLVIRALAGAIAIAAGERPEEFVTHVGYLVSSVCVMPIAVGSVTNAASTEGDGGDGGDGGEGGDEDDEDEDGRVDDQSAWSAGVIAVAAIAVTVIVVRLQQTM